jgi:hypothetical protein
VCEVYRWHGYEIMEAIVHVSRFSLEVVCPYTVGVGEGIF